MPITGKLFLNKALPIFSFIYHFWSAKFYSMTD